MRHKAQVDPGQDTFLPQSQVYRWLIIGFLFLAALGVRLPYINRIELHPAREYRSALIARGYYFETLESIPEWKRQVAIINRQEPPPLEPRILELLASIGYRLIDGEHLWVPQLLSSLFWLSGGVFLYLFAKKVVSTDEAVLSTMFYLFFPYGAYGSKSFMPDPMMVMTLLFSVLTIFQYYEKSTGVRLLIAAGVSGISMFVKPFGLFPILGVFVSLGIFTKGTRKLLVDKHLLIFLAVSLLLPVIHYCQNPTLGPEFGRLAQKDNIVPHFVLQPLFWANWLYQIYISVGFLALILGLLGTLLFHQGLSRATLIGLWGGYFIWYVVFNCVWTVRHPDYYHLMLVPIIALSVAPLGFIIIKEIQQRLVHRSAGLGIFLLCVLFCMVSSLAKIRNPYPLVVDVNRLAEEVRISQEIGRHVGHSTKTIFLAYEYGCPLRYHGELAGVAWPHSHEFTMRVVARMSPEERFNILSLRHSPEYFIITDLHDLKKQEGLREFLTRRFPILVQTDDYLVFDLRKKD